MELLRDLVKTRGKEIDDWFKTIIDKTPPFFYNSVDLRNSGFKLAPVDTNLFPAGFNNLNGGEKTKAVNAAKEFFRLYHPKVQKILLVTEDHTRNTYYLDNIVNLIEILEATGRQIEISNISTTNSGENLILQSRSGQDLVFKPMITKGEIIQTTEGFIPDLVIVNNDLSDGIPEFLSNIVQPFSPPISMGWHQRRKTSHFETYNNMARDFCNKFGIDPWLITTYFQRCGVVNFKEKTGLECLAVNIEKVLSRIRLKYEEYGIKEEPYVFIKSDRGTYGMGIMTAKSGSEIFDMGKNAIKKMNFIKGGLENTEVIIQEGIPTIDRVEENPAEPMIYLVGGEPVGCMYRLNTKKDSYENLNASGMGFVSIKHHSSDHTLCNSLGLIAKLASHAAAWECYDLSYSI